MSSVEKIQADIESLSKKDFVQLRAWFIDKFWNQWDDEIEKDSEAGKLDFLHEEAKNAKASGTLRDL